jgi:hypothetical protein
MSDFFPGGHLTPGLPELAMEYLREATVEEAVKRTSTSTEERYPD